MSFVRNLFFSVFLGVWGTLSAQEERVIPVPREVLPGTGEFRISEVTAWHTNLSGAEKESLVNYAAAELSTGRQEWHGKDHTGKDVVFFQKISDAGIHPEGYVLEVKPEIVTVSASTATGLFYGLQSLLQLMKPDERGGWTVPAVTVKDSPRFGYRGFMIDVSRHFRPKEFVKKQIDAMARYKLNRLHLHLTDAAGWRIEIKKYPRLTSFAAWRPEAEWKKWWNTAGGRKYCEREDPAAQGGYYTQEDIRELVRYAAERHITIIPEIEMPAHSEEVLAAYPGLSCAGEPYKGSDFCVGNEETFTFLENVLTEVMALFPSEYIHIGGDEAGKQAWKSCPKCRRRMADEELKNEDELQSYLICRVEKFLNGHGRKLLGWDEIMEGGLAPNATVMSWRGEAGGIEAARQQHNVIMTPNTYLYFDYYQAKDTDSEPLAIGGYLPMERVYSYEPMPSALSPEEQKFITGVQANLWTEYIPTMAQAQYMVLPRMAALCETQWSAPEKKQDYQGFLKRTARLTKIYQLKGWNYATHIFDVNVNIAPNTETGKLDVTASTIDDAPVYYTLDGTEPTTASSKYENGLTIDAACVLRMMAVRPEGNSRITRDSIAFSKSTAKPITMLQPINKPYEFKGATTLVDGMTGDRNYKTGRWIAFYKNDMEAVIDLKEATEISSMTLRTCVEKGDWTFDTRGITVEVSDDNKTFKKVASEAYLAMKETDANQIYTHTLTFDPVKTRYVKVTALSEQNIPAWHGGKGNPGFLFVDEIVLN